MNFVSYCPSSRPHTSRITDAYSESVSTAAGRSGAEATQRDVNYILSVSQTVLKQQQQPLELMVPSQLKSSAVLITMQLKQGWNITGGSI